ncbi:MAG: TIGR04255 family protein [Acidobacteriota bacterium]|nr:TIGR04255 family protein [Acidobacteriota bacterium]
MRDTLPSAKQMESPAGSVPDFDDPPVTETLLDVAFSPLASWRIPHFGLFWETIKQDYPYTEDQPPVLLQRERFGVEPMKSLQLAFQVLQGPEARCWFISSSQSRLIQVQNDRFIQNWRKVPGEEPYPHYDTMRVTFAREWKRFCDFLAKESLGVPDIQQCEIQYINHIEHATWQSYVDLVSAFSLWPGNANNSELPNPEDLAVNTTYLLPNNRGRLRVNMQSVIRNSDAKRVIQLTLTARGTPESSSTDDMLSWLDFGRDWIKKAFMSFSTEKMHLLWKKKG